MKLLLFTKNNKEYEKFIDLATIISKEIKIIYSENHPRKKDKSYGYFLRKCKEFNPDLIISFYYNKIIQQEIIDLSKVISVNFHGSILPNYAGSHALNWQIINGEKISGVTVHTLTSKVDCGDIILQEKFKIFKSDTGLDVLRSGIRCSCDLLLSLFSDIESNSVKRSSQKPDGSEFLCRKRNPRDSQIVANMSPEYVYNLIRALIPHWPSAFYIDKNYKKVTIENIITEKKVEDILKEISDDR
jgi:methionyl-tRNA formyltransferase